MDSKKLSNYLSDETMKKVTMHISHKKKDDDLVDEDCCLLSDGTIILIDRVVGGLKLPENFLNNPYNISIESECLIIVKFKENDNDEKYKQVRFKVSSLTDLENQWKKYRAFKELGDIYGIISSIEMTPEQMDANSRMAIVVNKLLNVILEDDIDIFACPPEVGKKRYKLISSIITSTVNSLILSGQFDSLYCPTAIKNEEGIPISIIDRIDMEFIRSRMSDMNPYDELEDDEYE